MTKVLVAEDEQDIRDSLVDILVCAGYDVIGAEDGGAAFALALREHPDIILLDVMMPVMDGFQVLKNLKENPSTQAIPVVMLSAVPPVEGERNALGMGADHYLAKPSDPDVLQLTVKVALREAGAVPDSLQGEGSGNNGHGHYVNSRSPPPIRRTPLRNKRSGSPPTGRVDQPKASNTRKDLEDVARRFIKTKYSRVRGIKVTSVTESGPSRGLNVYKIQGVTTVLLGDIPGLQAKGFHFTVYVTRNGKVLDRQGRVL